MGGLFSEFKKKNGNTCYTFSQNKPAKMNADDRKVTITTPTGRSLELLRSLVSDAIHKLQAKGVLTIVENHEDITERHGPQTVR
jgi:hypothetical protein